MLPLFLAYGLGQALTDVFQTDTDAISSPYRPLVRKEIRRSDVLLVSLTGFTLSAVILGWMNLYTIPLGILATFGLVVYTYFKRRWWGGPAWNSWIVALLPIMGFLAVGGSWSLFLNFQADLLWMLAAVFFSYANFVVSGYFKDISADRETNYNTVQVRFGWGCAAVYSDILALLAAATTGAAIVTSVTEINHTAGIYSLALLAVAVLLNIQAQITLHRTRDEHQVGQPIATVVRCMVLYCTAIVLAHKLSWWPVLLFYYLAFELTLRSRPQFSQV